MFAKLIPTRIRGVIDYLAGILAVVLPMVLNWSDAAVNIYVVFGNLEVKTGA